MDQAGNLPTATLRNPPWNRDETILALDLYVRRRPTLPDQKDPEVVALSDLLNRYARKMGLAGDARLRNPNGVSMKVANLSRWNEEDARAGLRHGAKLEGEVYAVFGHDPPRLAEAAMAIRRGIEASAGLEPSATIDSGEYVEAEEGRLLSYVHLSRERSGKLVQAKKAQVLKATGRLECQSCNFDFHLAYGERGLGFMEVHHIKPISQGVPGQITRLEDLALVCANCHRMIHVSRPWLTVEALKKLVQSCATLLS